MKAIGCAQALALLAAGWVGAATNEAVRATPAPKNWTDNLKPYGDLRYRYDNVNDDSKRNADGEKFTRERERLRARLGVEARCNDRLNAGLELSTGQADPTGANQTLGGGFSKKEMRLNLAYADYSALPDSRHAAHVIAGKMKQPFVPVADLIVDADVTPEGLAARGSCMEKNRRGNRIDRRNHSAIGWRRFVEVAGS
jgi:hypothetical protein